MADIKANIDRLLPELQSTNANSQAALDTIGQSLQSVRDDLSQAGDTLPADARQDFQSRLDEAAEQLNEQLVAFQENQAETVQVLTDIEALPGYAQRAVRAHHNAAPLNDELQKLSAQGADLQGIATELATLQNKLAEAGEAGDSEHVAEWGHEDRPLDTTYPPFVEFKEELASYNPAQDPDGEKFRSLIPNMEELLSEVHSQVGDKSSTNGYSATLNNLKDRFEKTYSQVAVQKLELALQSHQDIADQVAGIKIMADDYSFDIGGVTDRDAPSGATVTLKGGETLPLSRRQLDDIMNADPAELEKSGALDWLKELLGIKPLAAAELPDNTPPVITRDPVEADYAEVRRDLWDALGNDDRREKLWNTFDAVHTPSNEYFDSPREDETFFKVAAGGDDVITQAELDKFLETVDQTSEADLMTLAQGKYKELYPNAVEPSADYEAVFASLASLRGANGPHRGSASSVTKFKEELNTLEAAVHGNTITAEQKQRLSDLEGNYLHQMAARIQGPSERYLKQIDEEMAKLSDAERADETLQQQLAKITQQDADLRARMAALQAKAADLQAQVTKPDATPVDAEVAELEGMLDTLEGLTDEINSAMAPYRDQANAEFIQLETSLSQIEASGEPITQEQKDSLFAQLTATETYAEEAADVRNRIYNEHQKTEVQNRIRALEEQGAQGADAYQKLTERLHHMSGSTLGFLDDFDVRYQNVFRRIDALQVNNEAAPAMLQPIDPNALNLDDFQQFKAEIDQLDLNSREGLIQASDIIAAQWEKIDPDNEDPIKASDEYLEALNELDKSVSIQVSKWVKAKIDDAMQQHQVSGYSLDDSTYATYNDERTHNKHIPYVGFNHLETDTDVRLDDYIIEQILRDENALDTKQKLDSKLNLLVGTARALSDSPSEVQLEELQSVLGRFDMERLQNEMASETEAVNSALNLAEAAMAQTSASGQLSVEQEEAIQDQLSVAYTKWWEADSKRDNWMGESNASYAVRIHIDSLEEKEQAGELSGSEKQQLQELRAQWQLIVDESYESLGEAKALREQLWERLRRTPVDRQTYAVDYYDSSDEYEDADIGVQERPKQDPSTLSRIALNMYKDHPEIKEALDSIERDYLLGYEYNDKSLDGKNGREFVRIGYLVAWLQENQNNPNYGRANADVVHQEDTFNIITNEQLDTLIKAVRDGSAKNYFEKVS
ncbi:MAG: hypothetical protein KTR14_05215 [Vampirovibrio sp.]|nr:hypothetical protein [Vampirovibrio sp.]